MKEELDSLVERALDGVIDGPVNHHGAIARRVRTAILNGMVWQLKRDIAVCTQADSRNQQQEWLGREVDRLLAELDKIKEAS